MISKQLIRNCIEMAKVIHHPNKSTKSLHFSFLIKNSTICSIGKNKRINASDISSQLKKFYNKPYQMLHSELDAILKSPTSAKDAIFVNIRVNKRRTRILNARPCESCLKLLWASHAKAVFFSTNDSKFQRITFR